MKCQLCTGPVMAKSLEDTAFFRYHRLFSLDEVEARLSGLARRSPHSTSGIANV